MIGFLQRRLSVRRALESARPRLYRLAWSWCHDADEANDVVQEACLKAMERTAQLRDPAKTEQWLVKIMSNVFLDRVRARREHMDITAMELEAADDGPLEAAQRSHAVDQVRAAIAELSVDQRMVLTMVDLQDFSYAEVSEALDIPVGTVMSRLCRARRRLKEQLLLQAAIPRSAVAGHLRRVK
ncbi:MAG: RNA polymerase sigma factor [Gammaproteobacteria bacterium]|nr:RNA polymerase sigma factor [Gammaproteobacteria bacterium]